MTCVYRNFIATGEIAHGSLLTLQLQVSAEGETGSSAHSFDVQATRIQQRTVLAAVDRPTVDAGTIGFLFLANRSHGASSGGSARRIKTEGMAVAVIVGHQISTSRRYVQGDAPRLWPRG